MKMKTKLLVGACLLTALAMGMPACANAKSLCGLDEVLSPQYQFPLRKPSRPIVVGGPVNNSTPRTNYSNNAGVVGGTVGPLVIGGPVNNATTGTNNSNNTGTTQGTVGPLVIGGPVDNSASGTTDYNYTDNSGGTSYYSGSTSTSGSNADRAAKINKQADIVNRAEEQYRRNPGNAAARSNYESAKKALNTMQRRRQELEQYESLLKHNETPDGTCIPKVLVPQTGFELND